MSLYYPTLTRNVLIGSLAADGVTQTAAMLTANLTDTRKVFETGGFSEAVFDVYYTVGATETLNVINITLEHSFDGTNFAQLTNESASSGTSTLYQRAFAFTGAAAGLYPISYRLDISYKYLRISVSETGVVTNAGKAYIECTLAGK